MSGTCLAAKGLRGEIRVFGCEPELADDTYRSLQLGVLQKLESSETIADGLRASLAPRTFAILREHLSGVLLVSEDEIVAAVKLVAQRMKIVIEPSSAVALAPLLRSGGLLALGLKKRKDGGATKIGVILSGGNVELGG